MTDRMEVAGDRGGVADPDVLEMLRELISRSVLRLSNVEGRKVRAGDTINSITSVVGKEIADIIGMLMSASGDVGFGKLLSCTTT